MKKNAIVYFCIIALVSYCMTTGYLRAAGEMKPLESQIQMEATGHDHSGTNKGNSALKPLSVVSGTVTAGIQTATTSARSPIIYGGTVAGNTLTLFPNNVTTPVFSMQLSETASYLKNNKTGFTMNGTTKNFSLFTDYTVANTPALILNPTESFMGMWNPLTSTPIFGLKIYTGTAEFGQLGVPKTTITSTGNITTAGTVQAAGVYSENYLTGIGSNTGIIMPDGSKTITLEADASTTAGVVSAGPTSAMIAAFNVASNSVHVGVLANHTTNTIDFIKDDVIKVQIDGAGSMWASGTYYGNGSGLTNVSGTDATKVLKAGDTMTGQLTNTYPTASGSPFVVTSTTVNTNLNADLLDGNHYNALPYLSTSGGTVVGDIVGNNITATAGYFFEGNGSHLTGISSASTLSDVLTAGNVATETAQVKALTVESKMDGGVYFSATGSAHLGYLCGNPGYPGECMFQFDSPMSGDAMETAEIYAPNQTFISIIATPTLQMKQAKAAIVGRVLTPTTAYAIEATQGTSGGTYSALYAQIQNTSSTEPVAKFDNYALSEGLRIYQRTAHTTPGVKIIDNLSTDPDAGAVSFESNTATGAGPTGFRTYQNNGKAFWSTNNAGNVTNFSLDSATGNMVVRGGSAIGPYITTTGTNVNVIGAGVSAGVPLANTTSNSFAVGFNSDVPTLTVGPSSGAGTYGPVAIGGNSSGAALGISATGTAQLLDIVYGGSSTAINIQSSMPSNISSLIYGYEYGSGPLITLGSDKGANFAVDYNGNLTADGTVDGATGFKVGAAVGISCSAINPATSTLTYTKGILTNCVGAGCTCP